MTDDFNIDDRTSEQLTWVADQLGLDAATLSTNELVEAVLATPRGERLLVEADHTLDRGLRRLFVGMSRDDGYIDHGPDWIEFLSRDAHVIATVKGGLEQYGVLSVQAHLLDGDHEQVSAADVESWVAAQPQPVLGLLSASRVEAGDGPVEHRPLLSVDLRVDGVTSEFLSELIEPYSQAWVNRSVAVGTAELVFGPDGEPYRVPSPEGIAPRNAWLLMGSEASFPSPEFLASTRRAADAGLYATMWTAPKNGEVGDLAVLYFAAPRKAAYFVMRLVSRPFWRTDVSAAADRPVVRHQWWAWITPPIEIKAIPYNALREAAGGYLTLKGRSGHYLSADSISKLAFTAANAKQQADVDRVVKVPVGMSELPSPRSTSFDEWRQIPGALLPLEAKVSEHIVGPLVDFLWDAPYASDQHPLTDRTLGPALFPEYRVTSGYVDFVVMYGGPPTPALAVEVKLAAVLPPSGLWADSEDFQQLTRYMADLGTPGLLVDAQRVLLVRPGADAPYAEIVRTEATWEDIEQIRHLLLKGWAGERAEVVTGESLHVSRRVVRRGAAGPTQAPSPVAPPA